MRSDIKVSASKLTWETPWTFQLGEAATPLKFMLGRGAPPRLTMADGTSHDMASGVLQQ